MAPERLAGWLAGFRERHGPVEWTPAADSVVVRAEDGSVAECRVPFPPLGIDPNADFGGLLSHALGERTVGVLLVRLGGHAAGVFVGPCLVASKVGVRPVHGRSAAGGWSQQRFARRRANQSQAAWAAAADVAARVLLPSSAELDAVVVGGDRQSLEAVLADPRLAPLHALVSGPVLEVPDPRQRVLLATHAQFRAVRIRVLNAP
ncbi:MAG: acVLRF1 family peptidyl-tRNA hydrolase [Candidatus Dormibacteria bacterium]